MKPNTVLNTLVHGQLRSKTEMKITYIHIRFLRKPLDPT